MKISLGEIFSNPLTASRKRNGKYQSYDLMLPDINMTPRVLLEPFDAFSYIELYQ